MSLNKLIDNDVTFKDIAISNKDNYMHYLNNCNVTVEGLKVTGIDNVVNVYNEEDGVYKGYWTTVLTKLTIDNTETYEILYVIIPIDKNNKVKAIDWNCGEWYQVV